MQGLLKKAAIVTTVVVLGGYFAFGGSRPRKVGPKKQASVVPAVVPADTSALRRGDYVALTLRSADGSLEFTTWGRVLTVTDDRQAIFVRLVGEFTKAGAHPIPKAMGVALGDRIAIGPKHVLEVFSPPAHGTVLCGHWLREASGHDPVAANVIAGDTIEIWVAPADPQNPMVPGPGWDVPDPVQATVRGVSPLGHVLHVVVASAPVNTGLHGVSIGDVFDITRECIAGFVSKGPP